MHAIALLPALLLATPAIDGAKVDMADGRLRLEVTTSEPVSREDIRAKLDDKGLSVYVEGAELGSARRSFGTPELSGSILPRTSYAKIEIPLQAALGCTGPATISVTDTGLRTLVPCKPVPPRAEPTHPAPAANDNAIPVPPKAAAPVVAKTEAVKAAAEAPKPEAVKAIAVAPAPTPAASPTPTASPTAAAPAAKPAVLSPPPTGKFSSLPMMGLTIVLAIGGYLVWKRKKHQKSGLIRILETASLGPKRALIIAEVNGEKMILGTSEAGISLLAPLAATGGAAATTAAAPAAPRSLMTALATAAVAQAVATPKLAETDTDDTDIVDAPPENEGGLLAKLFRRRQMIETEDDGPSTMAEDFRDLLNDSLEDEELRRRLQSGLGGRTQ